MRQARLDVDHPAGVWGPGSRQASKRGASGLRASLLVVCALTGAALLACTSLRPVSPTTRLGGQAAAEVVLVLAQPCSTLPGGTPMGRPDGVRSHMLPAGRYLPRFEDAQGVYFASPTGISVTEPAPRGTRVRPGGIYIPSNGAGAWEYLGDAADVTERQQLPKHCQYSRESAK